MAQKSVDLNSLDYEVWGQVLSQAATEAKTVPEFKDALQLFWSALPEKTIDNAEKDFFRYVCQPAVDTEHIM